MKTIKRFSMALVALFTLLLIPLCSHAQLYAHGGAGAHGTSQYGVGYTISPLWAAEAIYFQQEGHLSASRGGGGVISSTPSSDGLGASVIMTPFSVLGLDVLGKVGVFKVNDQWKESGGVGLQYRFGQARLRLMRERVVDSVTTFSVVLEF